MNDKIKVAIEVDKDLLESFVRKTTQYGILVEEATKNGGYTITVSEEYMTNLRKVNDAARKTLERLDVQNIKAKHSDEQAAVRALGQFYYDVGGLLSIIGWKKLGLDHEKKRRDQPVGEGTQPLGDRG